MGTAATSAWNGNGSVHQPAMTFTHLHLSEPLLELGSGRVDDHLRPTEGAGRLTSISTAAVSAGITRVPAAALPTTLGEGDGCGYLVVGVGGGEGRERSDGSSEFPEGGVRIDGDGGGKGVGVVVRSGSAKQCRVSHGTSLHPEVVHAGGERNIFIHL